MRKIIKKRKGTFFIVISVLILLFSGNVAGRDLYEGVEVLQSTQSEIILELTPQNLEFGEKIENGQSFKTLEMDGFIPYGEAGKPQLPVKGFNVGIPIIGKPTVSIIDAEYETRETGKVYPAPKLSPPSDGSGFYQEEFYIDDNLYSQNKFFPEIPVKINHVGFLRSQRLANLSFFPVQYNPVEGELRVYKKIKVKISFDETFIPAEVQRRQLGGGAVGGEGDFAFEKIYEKTTVNFSSAKDWRLPVRRSSSGNSDPNPLYRLPPGEPEDPDPDPPPILVPFNDADYLLIVHNSLYDYEGWVYTLALLKDSQGLSVGVKQIYDGETTTDIKGYITEAYYTSTTPSYVFLVGDAFSEGMADSSREIADASSGNMVPGYYEDIPCFFGTIEEVCRDDGYVCITTSWNEYGGEQVDYFPDLHVGRIPAETITEVNNFVNKLEEYENNTFYADWKNNALFITYDYDKPGYPGSGAMIKRMTELMRDNFFPLNWDKITELGTDYPQGNAGRADREAAFENAVNTGQMIINGFGTGARWDNLVYFYYDSSNYNNLTNLGMYPFLVAASCDNGSFQKCDPDATPTQEAPVVVEKLLLHQYGIIGAFAPTGGTGQGGNIILSFELYKCIFENNIIALGPAITMAKINFESVLWFRVWQAKRYSLFGDPAMELAFNSIDYTDEIIMSCDDAYDLYVNSRKIGSREDWHAAGTHHILFNSGENVIAVKGKNDLLYGGLLFQLTLPNGIKIVSDGSWKYSLNNPARWNSIYFDDSSWPNVTDYGAYGSDPWGYNVSGMPTDTPARWIWSDGWYDDLVYFRKNIYYYGFDHPVDTSGWVTWYNTSPGEFLIEDGELSYYGANNTGWKYAKKSFYTTVPLSIVGSGAVTTISFDFKQVGEMYMDYFLIKFRNRDNTQDFGVRYYERNKDFKAWQHSSASGHVTIYEDLDLYLDFNTFYNCKFVIDDLNGTVKFYMDDVQKGTTVSLADITQLDEIYLQTAESHYHLDNILITTSTSDWPRKPITALADSSLLPQHYDLAQNYPNPFNPMTVIRYQMPDDGQVTLKMFNILGQEVATLVDKRQVAGYHQVTWDGSDFASGIYFVHFKAGEFHKVRKMILVK
ncbi:T9SS type A sorting domain-containing protein [candidate division KSB1 bacterium]|nr:T9SS type A sorting domain-containing protein [candidate division KSB1 bacterium]